MADHTRSLPDFESLEINPKTVAYSCLDLDVAELIGSIRWDAASVLKWRLRSSAWFAHQVLMRMGGEFTPLELRAGMFANALWPGISEGTGKQRISDLIKKLNEDQEQSGFWMIYVNTRRKERREDGSWYNLPTLYTPAEFPSLFYHVQMAAIECDLCNLEIKERRARQRSIIETWLLNRGCQAISKRTRKPKEKKEQKEKNTSSECENPCAHCSLKDAARDIAIPRIADVRVTKESVEAELHALNDAIFECGQRWMNLGLGLDGFNGKVHRDYVDTIRRLRDAVKRANAPRLKLIGGQGK